MLMNCFERLFNEAAKLSQHFLVMAPIKAGIIGYGFSTKCFHLPFILPNPDLEVYAFLQRRPAPKTPEEAKALKWGHCTIDFPQARHYQTSNDFFQDQSIELVIVLTGDGTHGEFVEGALNAGKHGEPLDACRRSCT